jgi:hypothetical protein
MRAQKIGILVAVLVIASAAFADDALPKKLVWDGSRSTPVHLIPLKDELDQPIVPSESHPLPFSSRFTCAPCHDYNLIKQGLHFSASRSKTSGRPAEPWIWVDEKTGTVIPISYQHTKGFWKPEDLGLSAWDLTLLFGRHMTGGDVSEPPDEEMTPDSRWNVSGKAEINCLGCHNASRLQSHSEWAKQILRENFRWAATAAAGLGEVGGMASRLKGTWDVFDGPNPDDSEWAVAPFVRYNKNLFDSKHRIFFDLNYKPDDSRCLVCHSVAATDMPKFNFDEDVHSAAGLKCVGCHRNDIRHAMIRGYEGETQDYPDLKTQDFTCSGCHLGNGQGKEEKIRAGRLGAPYPRHKGIPAVHFDRLSCTTCHSGPLPANEAARVRTSRGNRLGIYGIARWDTSLPAIFEPVYIRGQNKKLTPHRLMWPAFWARITQDKIIPLRPEQVLEAAGDTLKVEEKVAAILNTLFTQLDIVGNPLLVTAGKVFELNVDGTLLVNTDPALTPSEEILWAIRKDGKIEPLIPDFDPDSSEPNPDIEGQVQKVLQALAGVPEAAGRPVLLIKNWRYQITEGYLEKVGQPGKSAVKAQLSWLAGDQTLPLVSDFQRRTIVETIGSELTLTEEQVGFILRALVEKKNKSVIGEAGTYAYISGGKMFRLNIGGKLEAKNHEVAAPVVWPLAHQVRPARQSLGVHGCSDCHSAGSDFLFSKVKGAGPLKTREVASRSAHSFMGLNKSYQMIFGLSFAVRPILKWVLFIAAIIIGSVLFLLFMLALGRATGLIEKRR